MMRRIGAVLVFAVLWCGATAAGPKAEVTYVANEGFLIEVGASKILIDAIFDDRTISYAHVPDELTLSKLQAGEAPFDEVDLVLVTHAHRDHFSVVPVLEHLKANSRAVFLGPPPAVKIMKIVLPEWQDLGLDMRSVDLELFQSRNFEVGEIRVEAIRFRHSPYMETDPETGEQRNRHANVVNLVYLIEIGDLAMLHVGDATLSHNLEFFEKGLFEKQEIDIVFLEFFDWSDETKAVLDRWMTPRHTVFMHLPPEPEKINAIEARLLQTFPNAVVFAEPMEEEVLQ
jgi:L-ascorbate metabolism protein UlaG (beta-lactamase superfamily)